MFVSDSQAARMLYFLVSQMLNPQQDEDKMLILCCLAGWHKMLYCLDISGLNPLAVLPCRYAAKGIVFDYSFQYGPAVQLTGADYWINYDAFVASSITGL